MMVGRRWSILTIKQEIICKWIRKIIVAYENGLGRESKLLVSSVTWFFMCMLLWEKRDFSTQKLTERVQS